jgi:hypothetical protein
MGLLIRQASPLETPNCELKAAENEYGIYTKQEIKKNRELLIDWFNITQALHITSRCTCNSCKIINYQNACSSCKKVTRLTLNDFQYEKSDDTEMKRLSKISKVYININTSLETETEEMKKIKLNVIKDGQVRVNVSFNDILLEAKSVNVVKNYLEKVGKEIETLAPNDYMQDNEILIERDIDHPSAIIPLHVKYMSPEKGFGVLAGDDIDGPEEY